MSLKTAFVVTGGEQLIARDEDGLNVIMTVSQIAGAGGSHVAATVVDSGSINFTASGVDNQTLTAIILGADTATAGQTLQNDGAGNVTWVTPAAGHPAMAVTNTLAAFSFVPATQVLNTPLVSTLGITLGGASTANSGLYTPGDGTATSTFTYLSGATHDLRITSAGAIERGSDSSTLPNGAAFTHNNFSHLAGFSDSWIGANGAFFATMSARNNGDFYVGFTDPTVAFNSSGFVFDYSSGSFSGGGNSAGHFASIGAAIYAFNWSDRSTVTGNYSKNFGDVSTVSGLNAFNAGNSSTVSGNFGVNFGRGGSVTGAESTNFSSGGIVSGSVSSNLGQNSTVSGSNAFNSGDTSTVSSFRAFNAGFNSTVTGVETKNFASNGIISGGGASSFGFNPVTFTGQTSASGGDLPNKFFFIGNGTNTTARSNCLTIVQKGDLQINTNTIVEGITTKSINQVTPKAALEVISKESGVIPPMLNTAQASARLALLATPSFTKLMIDPSGAANLRVNQPSADYTGDGAADPAAFYCDDREGEMWYNVELRTHQRIVWSNITATYIVQTF